MKKGKIKFRKFYDKNTSLHSLRDLWHEHISSSASLRKYPRASRLPQELHSNTHQKNKTKILIIIIITINLATQ